MLPQANVETLRQYKFQRIVTVCPHCFKQLLNEYPDCGGRYEVLHHGTFLAQLLSEGRLKPRRRVDSRVAFHDSCYLGRHNDISDSPRATLQSLPGLTLHEPQRTRDRGTCGGAGGAQRFTAEEAGGDGGSGRPVTGPSYRHATPLREFECSSRLTGRRGDPSARTVVDRRG